MNIDLSMVTDDAVLVEAARRKAILKGGDPDAAAGKVTKTTVSNYATLIASRVYVRSLAK